MALLFMKRVDGFDAVALRTAVNINSVSGLCLTKLDVLDGLEEISVCVGYANAAGETAANPVDAVDYENLKPVYETLPGWLWSTFLLACHSRGSVPPRRTDIFIDTSKLVPHTSSYPSPSSPSKHARNHAQEVWTR